MPLDHTHVLGQNRERSALDRLVAGFALVAFAFLALVISNTSAAQAAADGSSNSGGAAFQTTPAKPAKPATTPGMKAKLSADGRTAIPPEGAPEAVKKAILAANKITRKPYIYGAGHVTFKKLSNGYDCSSTISYALGNAGMLKGTPLNSTGFMSWGLPGKGEWVTVYTSAGHAYVMIAGLRLDTAGPGEEGPRWRPTKSTMSGFKLRHPAGF
ncbi:MAG: hypothetical protein HYX29_02745 [Solirubrobacterales bacterium]|nr:hypothetical protein [Solirubrobacterales bacterium]